MSAFSGFRRHDTPLSLNGKQKAQEKRSVSVVTPTVKREYLDKIIGRRKDGDFVYECASDLIAYLAVE